MIARAPLPSRYAEWNRKHHAPWGRRGRSVLLRALGPRNGAAIRYLGPYCWQPNTDVRRFEYPWAFEQIESLGRGLTVADIGAGLAGFQFTLAAGGYEVHAVDPGMRAKGKGWDLDPAFHQFLSRTYRAPVTLHPTTLDDAGISDASTDVVLSISTIEHFTGGDLDEFVRQTKRILRPGGHVVFTIDLFLDVQPFGDTASNRYGTNVDIADLLQRLGAELVVGERSQLHGFPEFDPEAVRADLDKLMIGKEVPALAQCVVARVP
jgi:SAM-dependent methyltransferase